MRKKIRDRIFSADEVTRDGFSADVILVFGAGYLPDGTPSDMLADRIRTGAELFLAGAGATLCLSGAVGADGHDEPAVMRRYALACGVPEDAIVTDPDGVSTYASVSYLARRGGTGAPCSFPSPIIFRGRLILRFPWESTHAVFPLIASTTAECRTTGSGNCLPVQRISSRSGCVPATESFNKFHVFSVHSRQIVLQ